MFHVSEQWKSYADLMDPAAEYVGSVKISRKPSFKDLYDKGVKVRRTRWCKGAAPIENYSNMNVDVSGRYEYRAHHYFCSEYKMWCTEWYELDYANVKENK
jgi:hypothetical protein